MTVVGLVTAAIFLTGFSLWIAGRAVEGNWIGNFQHYYFPKFLQRVWLKEPDEGGEKILKFVLQHEKQPNVFVYWKAYHFIGSFENGEQIHVYHFPNEAAAVFKTLERIHGKLLSVVEIL